MKYIIICLAMIFCVGINTVEAQKFKAVEQLGNDADQDTLTNGGDLTYSFAEDLKKGTYQIGFGVNVTKVSGTVAGTIYYQGSVNNSDFVTVASDILTDATNDYEYTTGTWPFRYARIFIDGTGTSVRYVRPSISWIPK